MQNNVATDARELPLMLTIMDIAELLRVSKNTAYNFVKTGTVPSIKVGHQIRVYREDMLNYIKASSQT